MNNKSKTATKRALGIVFSASLAAASLGRDCPVGIGSSAARPRTTGVWQLLGKSGSAGWTLDDHSADTSPLGTVASPWYVSATFGMITVGTKYNDVIVGNDVSEVICGHHGQDWLRGEGGNDTLYGGKGHDTLEGDEDDDILYGNEKNDDLYGDDQSNSHGNLDRDDQIFGGKGTDYADGGDGTNTCTSVQSTSVNC